MRAHALTAPAAHRITYDAAAIRQRLQELAYLNSSAAILLRVHPPQAKGTKEAPEPAEERLHYSGGLKEYVLELNRERKELHKPIVLSREARPAAPPSSYAAAAALLACLRLVPAAAAACLVSPQAAWPILCQHNSAWLSPGD